MIARRLLLLSPAFYGYWESVAEPLRAAGWEVVPHLYDLNATMLQKARHKVSYELPDRLGCVGADERLRARTTAAAVTVLREVRPHRVLAIKADVIGDEFWRAAHDRAIPVSLWLYDEIRRMRWTLPELDRAVGTDGQLLTYSRQDLQELRDAGLPAQYLPNAFDGRYEVKPRRSDEVVFVGARYPNREAQLQVLVEAGLPVRAYGRDWSHHPVDRARTWFSRRPALPAERDVDRAEAYGVFAGAAAALNVHNDQDGFTMRTFEIPGAGGLQLIDRHDVSEFYDPGDEILVYQSDVELVDLSRRALRDRTWARAIGSAGRSRTLAEHTFDKRLSRLVKSWA